MSKWRGCSQACTHRCSSCQSVDHDDEDEDYDDDDVDDDDDDGYDKDEDDEVTQKNRAV